MKQLQNNFTTPEQSKQLLKLGVPADSADCYFDEFSRVFLLGGNYPCISTLLNSYHRDIIPCWSVGRLIEIFIICTPYVEIRLRQRLIIEQLIASYEDVKKQGLIDFSKLED